jgi:hypothetical protein
MVQDPHKFWEKQRAYAFPGLSWNSIVTKFTVMVTDPAVIRHVFNHNRCVCDHLQAPGLLLLPALQQSLPPASGTHQLTVCKWQRPYRPALTL